MTNNFALIEKYMINENIPISHEDAGDLFFCIMLVRRGKDHPTLPAANYTFKSYYIDSIEKLHKVQNEIIKCCEMFGLRAYVSVNVKSKETFSKYCNFKFSQNVLNNEYKKPWAVIDHVFGKCPAANDKTWIIDVDDIKDNPSIVTEVLSTVLRCRSKHSNPIVGEIPTRSGIHILTRPFNLMEFCEFWKKEHDENIEIPDIKKDHITLLYENIDAYYVQND